MGDPSAHIYYKIDGEINHQYMVHGFYGQDIVQDEKLIFMIDNIHAELIFTNGRFSISCFYDESRFMGRRVNSDTQLAFIANIKFLHGEYYNLHMLGFMANSYAMSLPNLDAAIRQYDDLLFNDFGVKRETDSAFNSAITDIYTIMSESISSFENYLADYRPTFARQAPPKSMFDSSRNRKLAKNQVSIYEEYSSTSHRDGASSSRLGRDASTSHRDGASTLTRHNTFSEPRFVVESNEQSESLLNWTMI